MDKYEAMAILSIVIMLALSYLAYKLDYDDEFGAFTAKHNCYAVKSGYMCDDRAVFVYGM